jgi:hypothetical protein
MVSIQDEQQTNFRSWTSANRRSYSSSSSRLRFLVLGTFSLFLAWEILTRSFAAYLADTNPDIAIRLRSNTTKALVNLAEKRLKLAQTSPTGFLRKTSSLKSHQSPPKSDIGSPTSGDTPLTLGWALPLFPEYGKATSAYTAPRLVGWPLPSLPKYGESIMSPIGIDSQEAEQIRSWAELALRSDPLNARAFRILGLLSQRGSDLSRTTTLMQAAARRSLLESVAVIWMMLREYEHGNYRLAISYADALLRSRYPDPELALQVLSRIAEHPDASAQLKDFLVGDPPWREQFFMSLPTRISDARSPLGILLSLKGTRKPPTPAELRPYLQFLVGHGFHELAYYAWLQFLPSEALSRAGHLFNGSFEFDPSGLPFDWTFSAKSGVTIQIANRVDSNGRALFLEFGPGRIEDLRVAQLVVLPPGNYRFLGKHQVDTVSQRGLQWRIKCVNRARTQIGQSPPVAGSSVWDNFEFPFTIPETDCPVQHVQLVFDASSASERFIAGSLWYDDLRIVREPSSEP